MNKLQTDLLILGGGAGGKSELYSKSSVRGEFDLK